MMSWAPFLLLWFTLFFGRIFAEQQCTESIIPSWNAGTQIQSFFTQWQAHNIHNATLCFIGGIYTFDVAVQVPTGFSLYLVGISTVNETFLSAAELGSLFYLIPTVNLVSIKNLHCTDSYVSGFSGQALWFEAINVVFEGGQQAINIYASRFIFQNSYVKGFNNPMGGFGAVEVQKLFYASITNSTFIENDAASGDPGGCGAGLSLFGINEAVASAYIDFCIFEKNNAPAGGGALVVQDMSLTVINSSFIENIAGSNVLLMGGAISYTGPSLMIFYSNFTLNNASCGGAALAASVSNIFTITGSLFSENDSDHTCMNNLPINATLIYHGIAPQMLEVVFAENMCRQAPDSEFTLCVNVSSF